MPIAHSALPYFLCLLPKALTFFFFLFAYLWDNSPRQDGAERPINVGQKEFYFGFLGQMSYNVLGIRRFASPNKQTRSVCRATKLWLEQGVGTSEATDLVLRKPEPPKAAKRLQSCYVLVCVFTFILYNYFFILL